MGSRRVGPGGQGPKSGGPKFRAFVSLSRAQFWFCFFSLGVFSCLFFLPLGGGLVSFSLSLGDFWCSFLSHWSFRGLSFESPRRPAGRRGFTRQPESPNVHICGSTPSKTPANSTKRPPMRDKRTREDKQSEREKKTGDDPCGEKRQEKTARETEKQRTKTGGGRGKKKARNFGRSHGGRSGGLAQLGLGLSRSGLTRSGPESVGA